MKLLTVEAMQKREKPLTKTAHSSVSNTAHKPSTLTAHKTTTYRLIPELCEHRKSNHLCDRCGEKYTTGHRCKNKQLNCIIGENEEVVVPGIVIEGVVQQDMQEAICLSALSDNHTGVNSILVQGVAKNRHLTVLVD